MLWQSRAEGDQMIPDLSSLPPGIDQGTTSGAKPRGSITQHLLGQIDALSSRLGRTPQRAPHLATGLRGEEKALFHLQALGYVIVARRWSTPKLPGDVDLIAWEADVLCFIEVKTRTGRNIVPAEFSVDQHKQKTLRSLASIYWKHLPEALRQQTLMRFDVVSVYLPARGTDAPIEFDLFRAAFSR